MVRPIILLAAVLALLPARAAGMRLLVAELPPYGFRVLRVGLAEIRADGTCERIVAKYYRLRVVPVSDDLRRRDYEPNWTH